MSSPSSPLKASHRFIKQVLETAHAGKVAHFPEEYEFVSRIFKKAGGSWEKVFQGSVDDVLLLKKVVKVAVKNKYLTPSAKWTPKNPKGDK